MYEYLFCSVILFICFCLCIVPDSFKGASSALNWVSLCYMSDPGAQTSTEEQVRTGGHLLVSSVFCLVTREGGSQLSQSRFTWPAVVLGHVLWLSSPSALSALPFVPGINQPWSPRSVRSERHWSFAGRMLCMLSGHPCCAQPWPLV